MTEEVNPYEKGENGHAKYSPSSLGTYEKCPRFGRDPGETNEAAEAGTRQHEAVETGDLSKLLDQWERERVLECQMVEQALQAEFPNAKVVKELKVTGIFNHGSVDLALLDFGAGVAVIVDWKMGQISVDCVDRNIQIWNYCLNLFTMYAEIQTIHAGIFQPKVNSELQRTVITRDMIPIIDTRIRRIISRREDPNTEPTPEASACMYCNQKATCGPWQDIAQRSAREEYGLVLPDSLMSCIDMPADQVGDAYRLGGLLEDYAKQFKKAATARADAIKEVTGEYPEGVGMVARKGNLVCRMPAEVAQVALGEIGEQLLYESCITIKASKLVTALNKATKKPAEEIVAKFMELGWFERGADVRYLKVKGVKKDAAKLLKEKYS